MKNKYTNINEEVERIKSLFTEERLYGNLIDSPTLPRKNILVEGGVAGGLGEFIEIVWKKAFAADPKLKGLDFPSRTPGGVKIRIEPIRNADGTVNGVKVLRNGISVDPKALSSYISEEGLAAVKTSINLIHDKNSLMNFFRLDNEEGIYGVFETMINDMKYQNMIDDDSGKRILEKLKKGGIGGKITTKLRDKDIFKGIYTLEDLKRIEPQLSEIFDHIPGLRDSILGNTEKGISGIDSFKNNLALGKIIGGDAEAAGRYIADLTADDPIVKTTQGATDKITIHTTKNGKTIHFDKEKMVLTIKDGSLLKTHKLDMLDPDGQEFISDLLKGKKIVDVEVSDTTPMVDWSYELKRENLADAMASSVGKRKGVFQSRKSLAGERTLNKLIEKTKLNLDNAFRVAFRDNRLIEEFRETFSTGFRKHFNINKLKRERYGKSVPGSTAPHTYNENQVKFIETIYEVPEDQNLFVLASDKELINAGSFIGEVNPNATKKKYWKQEIYNTWRYGTNAEGEEYNAQKVFGVIFNPNEKGKDFSSWQKKIGRGAKLGALWTTMWTWWPCAPLGWCDKGLPFWMQMSYDAITSVWVMWRNFWVQKIIDSGFDITIAKQTYQVDCTKMVVISIKNKFDTTTGFAEQVYAAMQTLVGEGVIGKVIVSKDDFEGDPPEKITFGSYNYDDESTPENELGKFGYDWWKKDSRTISNDKLLYPILDKLQEKNEWMEVFEDADGVFIRVWFSVKNGMYVPGKILDPGTLVVDKESNRLKKERISYHDFFVTCIPFGGPDGWFDLTYKKVMSVDMEAMLWRGFIHTLFAPGSTHDNVKSAFESAYQEISDGIDKVMIEHIDPILPHSWEEVKEVVTDKKNELEKAIEGGGGNNTHDPGDMKANQ